MKKIQFKLRFIAHSLKQFFGFKSQDDNIIMIWYDTETQDTCLFLKGRSGLWHMPVGRKCKENEEYQSYWLASMAHMSKYGILNKKNSSTIYTLTDVVKVSQNEA
jgi:hypothetical protein